MGGAPAGVAGVGGTPPPPAIELVEESAVVVCACCSVDVEATPAADAEPLIEEKSFKCELPGTGTVL